MTSQDLSNSLKDTTQQVAEDQDLAAYNFIADRDEIAVYWRDAMPAGISEELKRFSRYRPADLLRCDLEPLAEKLKPAHIRGPAVQALELAKDLNHMCAERAALVFGLLKCPGLSEQELDTVLSQLWGLSKKPLFAFAGQLLEKQLGERTADYAPLLLTHALPVFLSLRSYGADRTLESWESMLSKVKSSEAQASIYDELSHRAFSGKLSGYQHILNLLAKSDLSESFPVIRPLILKVADNSAATRIALAEGCLRMLVAKAGTNDTAREFLQSLSSEPFVHQRVKDLIPA